PAILVRGAQHPNRPERLGPEKELRVQIGFADFQRNPRPPVARQLGNQFGDHLGAHPRAPATRMHREIEDVQLRLVQLVNHEADYFFALLGDHADAVALPQTAEEVLLGPGEFETGLFGLQNLRHIAADHPANMDARLFFFRTTRAHERIPPSPRARGAPPWVHHAFRL